MPQRLCDVCPGAVLWFGVAYAPPVTVLVEQQLACNMVDGTCTLWVIV